MFFLGWKKSQTQTMHIRTGDNKSIPANIVHHAIIAHKSPSIWSRSAADQSTMVELTN